MVIIAVVNNDTLKIHTTYENDVIDYNRYKCKMSKPEYFTHIALDESLSSTDIHFSFLVATKDEEDNITVSLNNLEYTKHIEKQELKKIERIKQKRNKLLLESDWTQLPDVDLTSKTIMEHRVYRQELRDLDISDLDNVIFPKEPKREKKDKKVKNIIK